MEEYMLIWIFLVSNDLVLTKSTNSNTFTNEFYMVEPKNKFIKYCIENLNNYKDSYWFLGKHMHVMSSTGPYFLTNMINQYKLINIPNYYILSVSEYGGDCTICNEDNCNGGIYIRHIKGLSIDSLLYNFILCNYKKLIFLIIIFIIIFLIFYLNYIKLYKLKKLSFFTYYIHLIHHKI
jgi:mannosyltransferase OCH1-like enzyme